MSECLQVFKRGVWSYDINRIRKQMSLNYAPFSSNNSSIHLLACCLAAYTSLIFTCCRTYRFRKVLARRRWNFGVTFEARYADKTARSPGLLAKNAVRKTLTQVRIFQVKALHDTVGRVRIAAGNRQALFQEIAIRAVNLGRHISIHRC